VRKRFLLFAAIPLAVILHYGLQATPLLVFPIASFALIPAAYVMTQATDELATKAGPGIGGLLNVTFGNGPELILAFFSLIEGLHEVVKASLVGSILGNVLLVMGGSMLVGGWRRDKQEFNRTAVQAYAGMLLLAVTVLLLPTLMQIGQSGGLPSVGDVLVDFDSDLETLSLVISVVLIASYAAGMFFSLRTHRDVFNPKEESGDAGDGPSLRSSIARLAVAGMLVAVTSELMVGTITQTAALLGTSEFFLGIVVMAIVGNAAEHWVAIVAAREDRMQLSIGIALGSSAQIALVVAPVLCLASFALPHPLALVFNPYEVGALLFAVLIANYLTLEGESNWFEGVQLLVLYAALGALFLIV
jgi:Ca2+:H+ antiporter